MRIEVEGDQARGIVITQEGKAIEFQEMVVKLRPLEFKEGLKAKIQETPQDKILRVTLTANSPLTVVAVEVVS